MNQLQVTALQVAYKRRVVLHGIDLPAFEPGQIIALVGPNGAGKSTLLRALAGLLPATGQIHLGALDLRLCSRRERAAVLGFMPQTLPEGIELSVLETLMGALRGGDPLAVHGSPALQEQRCWATLERLGIVHLGLQPLDKLSGGQRQMVSLAQAVIRKPQLLLLDEPTSALDLRYQNDVMQMVRGLADEGRIVVVVLHDLALAARWADRIVVLQDGRLHTAGTPEQCLTPAMLAQVYRVQARIERCSRQRVLVHVDGSLS